MRQVDWTMLASRDLDELVAYIAEDSEQNANLVGDRIERAASHLGGAAIGHFGRVQNSYEFVVPKTSYILAYEKAETKIIILRVIHGSREWQNSRWPADD